jgi:DNA mismatch repair protein PMS2
MSQSVQITTATSSEAPRGTILELERSGKVAKKDGKTARQVGLLINYFVYSL